MKKYFFALISVLLAASHSGLNGQKTISNSAVTGVCYGSNKVNRIYIPPPRGFMAKSAEAGRAKIAVTYINCPQNVITAVDFAVRVWESILPDNHNIRVMVTWERITSAGVLANSSSTLYIAGWAIDAFKPRPFYPIALAEKIANASFNRDVDADLVLHLNNSIKWYYGTDGKTTVTTYDLATVALHELCHGLGFFDSFSVQGSNGAWGSGTIPLIYDTFVENQGGQSLLDTTIFPNPSSSLKTALTNGQVWFNGPLLKTFNPLSRAKLYAPSTFDAGSSIAHLDPGAVTQTNSLMAPFIDLGEAIHNPGDFTMSILGDLGWIHTTFQHSVPKDTEAHITSVNLTATVKSDTTYNHNLVGVVWSYDKFRTSNTTYMVSPQSDNNYTAVIPVSAYETRLEYFLFTQDKFLRTFRFPSDTSRFKNQVFIGIDTVKPLLSYLPQKFYFEKTDSIKFDVLATDNLGLDTVYVEYKINNGTSSFLGLKHRKDMNYSNALIPKKLSLHGGDLLEYRIIAVDKAAVPNRKQFPSSGFQGASIESVNPVTTSYTTNFTGAAPDYVFDGMSVTKPTGFSNFGLNTPHPYVSPETTGDSIGYTASLRTPFKFDANGMIITYDEVVLVEPGDDGTIYGMTDFFDYVVVEGSKNFGRTWFKLADGYDSRYKDIWLADYNSAITGNNSTFVGTEALLMKHAIFPKVSSDISAGDTLMVRFRLFSDPYANGWGWVVENLHIGDYIDLVEEVPLEPLVVYPNPGNGLINVRMPDNGKMRGVRYSVYNSAGIRLADGVTAGGNIEQIDLSDNPSGLYLIVFQFDKGPRTVKYTLLR